jgi:hypothetical protein
MSFPQYLRLSQSAFIARSLIVAAGAAAHSAQAQSGDVRSAPPTAMPAYTVEEDKSAKTHTLFMGADIALNLDKDLYKVTDVFGSNWVIDINGREKEVSARQAPTSLKITPNLKLTEVSAQIVGFRRFRAYTYDNDPSVLLTRGLSKSASMSNDLQAAAQNAQNAADVARNSALGGASVLVGADDQFSANAQLQTAAFAYSNTHPDPIFPLPSPYAPSTTGSTVGNTVIIETTPFSTPAEIMRAQFNNDTLTLNESIDQVRATTVTNQAVDHDEPTGKIATSGLDAMDVAFDIRSAKPLHNPYVVTMTRFTTRGAKPGLVQNMVYAQELHPIDEHLSHVHFVEGGFPYDYELIDFQLHIYDKGVEIATNVAQDRVELTRDEAFEYVKVEYIGAHPHLSLPATPAMARLPADLPARLASGLYRDVFYVRVSKEGFALGTFADEACSRRIADDYLASVVSRIRFKPSLDDGRPVEGVAAVNLGKLAI